MIDAEHWAEVRRLKRQEDYSIRAIARRMNLDRKTVRKILKQGEYPGLKQKQPARRGSILDPFKADIRRYLKESSDLTAVQIHRRLVDHHDYPGEITLVREYIRQLRQKDNEAFLRLTFLPGECAQVDWGTFGTIPVGDTHRRLSAFVMVLAYSRLMYIEFTLSEKMDAFLEAHVRAFKAFNGVTRRVLYDNCKTVVLDRRAGHVRFNPKLLEFGDHYGFAVRVCPPRRPWHKGRVESGIGYVRKSFARGRPAPKSLKAEQRDLEHWIEHVANQRLHKVTRRKPQDLFEEVEWAALVPLPEAPYDTAHVVASVSANRYFRVHFDGNQYSIPFSYALRQGLLLKATTKQVRIYADGTCIATHTRTYARGQDVLDDQHQRGLIEKKRRAERDTLLGRVVAALGPEAEAYAAGLVHAAVQTSRHLRRLLRLVDSYGADEVRQAIRKAMAHNAFGAEYIENILHQQRRETGRAIPMPPNITDPALSDVTVPEPNLSRFDNILTEPQRNASNVPTEENYTQQENQQSSDEEPKRGPQPSGEEPELPANEEPRG